jgi:polysaccharide biosynthesis transport protein
VRMDYLASLDQVSQIDQEYTQAEAAQTDLDRKRTRLESLLEERKRDEERQDKARKYLEELTSLSNRRDIVRIRTLQDAVRPLERSSPRWSMTIPAGTMLGLLLAVGLAMLLEFMNTSVRTPQDVVRYAGLPMLGMVPVLDDEEVDLDSIDRVTQLAPRSMMAECFRRTRTNLLFSCPMDRQRTVLVTSAQPEEGKTGVAVNLAIASAQSGRKVLLVDCNFRRPGLNRAFPQIQKQGLSNLLIGQCELKDLVKGTDVPTLDVLGVGPTPPNPAELLGSTYFRAFLSEAAGLYDQVFLDGPPGLLVTDALIVATAVDGVIVVARAGSTSRGALRRLRDTLDRLGAHVLGVVLNAAEVRAGGYFKELYRAYYDYDEQASKVLPADNGDGKGKEEPTEIEPPGRDA